MEADRDFNWTVLDAIHGVRPPGTRSPRPPSRPISVTGFVASAYATEDDDDPGDIPLAQLIQSLRHAGMKVSTKDEQCTRLWMTTP